MSATATWSTFVDDVLNSSRNRLSQMLTGKPAQGTKEREFSDLYAQNAIDTLKRQKPMTPQEEQEAYLRLQKGAAAIQSEATAKGLRDTTPLLLDAYKGKIGAETNEFTNRDSARTDNAIRLGQAATNQQGALTARNYGEWSNNVLIPVLGAQERMQGATQATRNELGGRIVGVLERNSQADIDYRNELLKQQNTGVPGFLNNVLGPIARDVLFPVAQLGIAAKLLSS